MPVRDERVHGVAGNVEDPAAGAQDGVRQVEEIEVGAEDPWRRDILDIVFGVFAEGFQLQERNELVGVVGEERIRGGGVVVDDGEVRALSHAVPVLEKEATSMSDGRGLKSDCMAIVAFTTWEVCQKPLISVL